jgi:mannose/fructose/N-acetylgalactosamine-specific phosphotransferase system component IIC
MGEAEMVQVMTLLVAVAAATYAVEMEGLQVETEVLPAVGMANLAAIVLLVPREVNR